VRLTEKNCPSESIANYYVVCSCEAVRSAILAIAWLLVQQVLVLACYWGIGLATKLLMI